MLGKRVDNEGGDEEVLAEVFKVFDKDGSGFIERSELQVGSTDAMRRCLQSFAPCFVAHSHLDVNLHARAQCGGNIMQVDVFLIGAGNLCKPWNCNVQATDGERRRQHDEGCRYRR